MPPIQSDFASVQMTTDEVMERFCALQPTALIGTTEAIALLAVEARRCDLPQRHRVQDFLLGQTLSLQLKQMIESGFDAELFNLYGEAETGWLGYECERHDGLHVVADRVQVQVARCGNPRSRRRAGELGEVIVTSLMRRVTPFIRYRLQDAAALDLTPCPCGPSATTAEVARRPGASFPRLNHWEMGRPRRHCHRSDRRSNSFVDHRIVQEARIECVSPLSPAPHFGEPDRQRIEQVMLRHLGAVQVAIDLVSEIPREPSGKRRRIFRPFDLEMTA